MCLEGTSSLKHSGSIKIVKSFREDKTMQSFILSMKLQKKQIVTVLEE